MRRKLSGGRSRCASVPAGVRDALECHGNDRIVLLVFTSSLPQKDELVSLTAKEERRVSRSRVVACQVDVRLAFSLAIYSLVEFTRPLCEAAAAGGCRESYGCNGICPGLQLIVLAVVTSGIETVCSVMLALDRSLEVDDRRELECTTLGRNLRPAVAARCSTRIAVWSSARMGYVHPASSALCGTARGHSPQCQRSRIHSPSGPPVRNPRTPGRPRISSDVSAGRCCRWGWTQAAQANPRRTKRARRRQEQARCR